MSAEVINLNDTNPAAPTNTENVKWQKGAQTGTDPTTGLPIFPVSANVPAATNTTLGVVRPDGCTITVDGSGVLSPSVGEVNEQTANYTLQASDSGKLVVINSASAVTVTLPATPPFSRWYCWVSCQGTGGVTIAPGLLQLDGSTASQSLTQGQGLYIATDGTNYFSSRGVGGGGTATLVVGFVIAIGTTGNDIGPMLVAPRSNTVSKCVVVVKSSDASTSLTFRINKNGTNVFSTNPTIAAATASGTVSTFTTLTSSPLTVTAGDVFQIDITSGTSNWNFTAQLE